MNDLPTKVPGPPVCAATRDPLSLDPLAVRGAQAAALCAISRRLWGAMDSAAKIPRGRKLCRAKVWLVEELRDWLRAGCPDRATWEARREGGR
jgi:hypothetical protein